MTYLDRGWLRNSDLLIVVGTGLEGYPMKRIVLSKSITGDPKDINFTPAAIYTNTPYQSKGSRIRRHVHT